MKNPHLIQRGVFSDRDWKKGIDTILEFDYMGSADFEYGALPKSLSTIRMDIQQQVYFDMEINGKMITVYCNKHDRTQVEDFIINLSLHLYQLQEYSDFDSYIYPSEFFKSKTDFWWDIENHYMFWKKDDVFLEKFKILIDKK